MLKRGAPVVESKVVMSTMFCKTLGLSEPGRFSFVSLNSLPQQILCTVAVHLSYVDAASIEVPWIPLLHLSHCSSEALRDFSSQLHDPLLHKLLESIAHTTFCVRLFPHSSFAASSFEVYILH
ncbi:hypothetical protein FXO37_21393 [Capsicum annuum]|nr:hypothetical protein FXO37_21393 [Capsicum annuum]